MLIREMTLIVIVILFSIYSFCYATLDSILDYKITLIFSFLALATLFLSKQFFLSKQVVFLYLCFLGLASVGVFFPPSEYVNVDGLVKSIAVLLLSSIIVAGFINYDDSGNTFFKWGLLGCLLALVFVVILHQSGIPIKQVFPEFAGFKPVSHEWNQKYYSFWLLFLMWGTISFHWRKSILSKSIAIGIMILTGMAIFTGYSDSAMLAFIFSVIIFVLMHIRYSRWLLLWQSLICLYIFTLPLAWSLLPSRWLSFIKSTNLNNVSFRVDLYSFTASTILKQWLWGYGFGSASSLLKRFPIETGGHPHNIVFLFWLEMGIMGGLLLALAITVLLSFIHNATRDRENAPAIWALVGSGLVIYSFSFDIWLPGVVLTYSMWLAMIMLSCTGYKLSKSDAPYDC